MTWQQARLEPFALRLRRPLVTARGPLQERRGWLLRVSDDAECVGVATAMPIEGFAGESFSACGEALAAALAAEADVPSVDAGGPPSPSPSPAAALLERTPFAASALELACLDLEARRKGRPLADLLAAPDSPDTTYVPVNALIHSTDESTLAAQVGALASYDVLKLKVGADVDTALALIETVCRAMLSGQRVRIDPNASWSEADARRALVAMKGWPIDYVEQPVASTGELARLRGVATIALAADESACDAAGLRAVIEEAAADVIVVKPMRAGGPRAALALAHDAQAAGLDVVITSLLDSAVGVRAALSVALALRTPPRACGLETAHLFECDWMTAPECEGARMHGWQEPGIGALLDESVGRRIALGRPRVWSRRTA